MLVVVSLGEEPVRFNELQRRVFGISQQMLTRTLRSLERDGLVGRSIGHTRPPSVHYALTDLGASLSAAVRHVADWAKLHIVEVRASQSSFDMCGSAWKRDPGSGVIGVEKGPLIPVV